MLRMDQVHVIRHKVLREGASIRQVALEQLKQRLQDSDSSVQGFNIGINCGEAAGTDRLSQPHSFDSSEKGRCSRTGWQRPAPDSRQGDLRE
jgi:hypothetical protein